MSNFEFLSYEPVVGEKYLGIATVRCYNRIILKYKIIPGKDGGFFAGATSIKNGDKYESAYMIDSQYENKLLMDMIREKVSDCLAESQPQKKAPILSVDDDVPF